MNNSVLNRTKEDLRVTVKELSDTYEELSLLYRLTEEFSGLGVDEICRLLLKEVTSLLDAKTAVVLFLGEEGDHLYTKVCFGDWDRNTTFRCKDNFLWDALHKKRTITICNTNDTGREPSNFNCNSVLIAPLTGKRKTIGLVMVADKTSGDAFYSGDMKLLTAITSQAALFIENAMLGQEMQFFLTGTIRSFVKALEASSRWTAGHTERVTRYAIALGRLLGLTSQELEKLRIASLLHDMGKIATPKEILNKADKLSDDELFEVKRHPIVGAEILSELKGFTEIIEWIKYHHEHYDGTGIHGLKGEEIPMMARILAVADAFDALTSDRPYRKRKTLEEAVREIKNSTGSHFDPKVVEAFLEWVDSSDDVISSDPEVDF